MAVRGTFDAEVVLTLNQANFQAAERAPKQLGLVSRIPVDATEIFQFREEYISRRNLMPGALLIPLIVLNSSILYL